MEVRKIGENEESDNGKNEESDIGENEKADRISKLPKDLLCEILSCLSTKEAALTSVLSKKWRYLFTQRPTLDFDDCIFVPGERSGECKRTTFVEFVNRVLALQSSLHITKISLRLHKGVDEEIVEDWVLQALRRGATDLTVIFLFPSNGYSLPSSIFSYAQNLIRLKIGRGDFGRFCSLTEEDIIITKLTTLHLDSIEFGDDGATFALLLSKCPVLEEMIVNGMKWHHWISDASVSSPTLKRVTIDCQQEIPQKYPAMQSPVPFHFGTASPYHVSFDTPNLMYLNYSDFVACKYPLVRLDSLVEARIDIGLTIDLIDSNDRYGVSWDATSLIMGIHNVQSLELTSDTLEVISGFCKTVPVFHYLNRLSIEGDDERGWQALPLLLINCPNLHTLIFHGLHHRVTDGCGNACDCISPSSSSSSCLSSCPLKILKILEFGATCIEMSLVEHFLKKLPQLEQVIIILDFDSAHEEDFDLFEVTKALEMAPRASPNCKLKVVNC